MSHCGTEKEEADGMRNALNAIANEIQMFQQQSNTTGQNDNEDNVFNKLIKYKTTLNLRTLQIKHLKSNLKTACALTKIISSTKNTEVATLNKHLNHARKQYLDLEKEQSIKNQMINNLKSENVALRDQLEFFKNAIQLGYQELQGIRNESEENVSALEQLKYIIVRCGKYHADHINELERCVRLQQKNRFLSTKMTIMENHLEAARDELRSLRWKEKKYNSTRSLHRHCFGVVSSDYKLGSHQKNFTKLTMRKIELTKCSSLANIRDLDLTIHLKTVNNLLVDHDNLIKDLKTLSKV